MILVSVRLNPAGHIHGIRPEKRYGLRNIIFVQAACDNDFRGRNLIFFKKSPCGLPWKDRAASAVFLILPRIEKQSVESGKFGESFDSAADIRSRSGRKRDRNALPYEGAPVLRNLCEARFQLC